MNDHGGRECEPHTARRVGEWENDEDGNELVIMMVAGVLSCGVPDPEYVEARRDEFDPFEFGPDGPAHQVNTNLMAWRKETASIITVRTDEPIL